VNVTHFDSAADFRRWLAQHHADTAELLVGFYKTSAHRSGLTYAAALDEALCFGWIDGLRKNFDAESYTIRFTPRKTRSIWSNVNVAHVARLTAGGRMRPAGLAAFAARTAERTGIYSFEKAPAKLSPADERTFRANKSAWSFFAAQAPWYRRAAIHKIVSPKQEATRRRWLARVMADSAAGRRIGELVGSGKAN